MNALEIVDLKKTYQSKERTVEALKGVTLNVEEGDFFALLGPNGAGKSTTIGIISALVNKTSGQVKIFGHDIDKELEKAKFEDLINRLHYDEPSTEAGENTHQTNRFNYNSHQNSSTWKARLDSQML